MKRFTLLTLTIPALAAIIAIPACKKDLAKENARTTGGLSSFLAVAGDGATFTPVADAYVRNGTYAGNNYGSATELAIKADAISYNRKSYIRFDLSRVAGSGIGAAILQLNATVVSSSRTVRLYTTSTETWTESGITWNNAPMDTTFVGQIAVSATGQYTIDVTSEINRQLALPGERNVSFLLLDKGAFSSTANVSFSSKEGGLTNIPKLYIVPSASDSSDVDKILANYDLVWNDEFSGTKMDTSKWSYRANGTVRQYATVDGDRTISLDGNGNMVIKVTKEGSKYYVGQATTDGHFNPRYGYYECRAKMNKTIGPHIAFWLQSPSMGNTPYNNPAVNGAEVDIFEYHRNAPGVIFQTIHINGYGSAHQSSGQQIPVANIDTGYHTFGLLWTDSSYKFYIDGYKTRETTFGLSKRTEYIILSTELTGFGGSPSLGQFPDSVVFDYVRVYQPR